MRWLCSKQGRFVLKEIDDDELEWRDLEGREEGWCVVGEIERLEEGIEGRRKGWVGMVDLVI